MGAMESERILRCRKKDDKEARDLPSGSRARSPLVGGIGSAGGTGIGRDSDWEGAVEVLIVEKAQQDSVAGGLDQQVATGRPSRLCGLPAGAAAKCPPHGCNPLWCYANQRG